MQMEVYLVVAQDCTAFAALEAVAPGHVVLAQHLMPEEAGYASPGSKQMRQVCCRSCICHTRVPVCATRPSCGRGCQQQRAHSSSVVPHRREAVVTDMPVSLACLQQSSCHAFTEQAVCS